MQTAVASWFVLRRRGERRGGILFPVGFPFRPALPCRKQRRVGVERRVGVGGGVQRLLGGGEKGSFCRSLASCSSSQPLTALDPGPRCLSSVQFSSVAQSCPTLCDPMNHSTPGLPVHHQLPEFTQTHVHRVSEAIQPSHPLSSPSPAPNPSQHQSLIQ